MAIIEQNGIPNALPDFRNLGVLLRTLLTVNLATMLAALLNSPSFSAFANQFSLYAALVEPTLFVSLGLLYSVTPRLTPLPYRSGVMAVLVAGWAAFGLVYLLLAPLLDLQHGEGLLRGLIYTAALVGTLLQYFRLRNKALSPALMEARLQALQARIRPHFLFNSINAVLSLIRSEPRKAERALEDLAELFRVLMAENNQLSTLWRELELARNYLALEQLRLGERLKIDWHTDHAPMQARLPPLILQPLLENAVYHGIEPHPDIGMISVNVYRSRNELHIDIRNPYQPQAESQHNGNKMAMGNIRERLALFFDAEASLKATVGNNYYQVHIVVPYRE